MTLNPVSSVGKTNDDKRACFAGSCTLNIFFSNENELTIADAFAIQNGSTIVKESGISVKAVR